MSGRPDCELCSFGEAPNSIFAFDASSVTASIDEPVTTLRVISRHHVREPFELPGLSRRRFWEEALIAARALREVTGAERISYEIAGASSSHVELELSAENWDRSRPATRGELASTVQRGAD